MFPVESEGFSYKYKSFLRRYNAFPKEDTICDVKKARLIHIAKPWLYATVHGAAGVPSIYMRLARRVLVWNAPDALSK